MASEAKVKGNIALGCVYIALAVYKFHEEPILSIILFVLGLIYLYFAIKEYREEIKLINL